MNYQTIKLSNYQTRSAFTLIELLVVVAVLAVLGAGVAVHYSRETVNQARRQTTLHEMAQIRDAFNRFYADNIQLVNRQGVALPESSTYLPTQRFAATFTGNAAPDAGTSIRFNRHYAAMEFFERFGLWFLFSNSALRPSNTAANDEFIVFEKSIDCWQGPYLDSAKRIDCVMDSEGFPVVAGDNASEYDFHFPQPATQFGGFYRVFYFEHCRDESRADEVLYRRLVLAAAMTPETFDEWSEIAPFTGNRRSGASAWPLNLATGAIENFDQSRGLFFMELLNNDTAIR